jgi:cytochrome c2
MSLKYSKKAILLLLLLVASNIFWLASAIENKSFPYKEFKSLVRSIERSIEVKKLGEDKYIEKVVSSQSAAPNMEQVKGGIIETAVLPISKKYLSLADSTFSEAGGALTIIDNKILILDRLGRLYISDGNQAKRLPIQVPNKLEEYIIGYEGEPILHSDAMRAHSVVYDTISSRIIVSFTRFEEKAITRLVVAGIEFDSKKSLPVGNWGTIYESAPMVNTATLSQSGGGKIIIKENYLLLSVGYNVEKDENRGLYASSQDTTSNFGKIIRIYLDNNKAETFSLGHRNVQGIALFNKDGVIATEHGPQGGDEVNIINQGGNYGWPLETYGTRYGTYDYDFEYDMKNPTGPLIEPFFAFVPSIGISSIIQLEDFDTKWDNDLLVGSLKAQTLYRLKQKEGRVIFQEPIWIGHRIRDIIQLKNQIFILTDDANLLSLSVDEIALKRNSKGNNLISKSPILAKCITCHQFTETTPASLAPSLANVYNRKFGSTVFERYSTALSSSEEIWNEENLKSYIKMPSKFLPGTSMPPLGLTDEEVNAIVALLKK